MSFQRVLQPFLLRFGTAEGPIKAKLFCFIYHLRGVSSKLWSDTSEVGVRSRDLVCRYFSKLHEETEE